MSGRQKQVRCFGRPYEGTTEKRWWLSARTGEPYMAGPGGRTGRVAANITGQCRGKPRRWSVCARPFAESGLVTQRRKSRTGRLQSQMPCPGQIGPGDEANGCCKDSARPFSGKLDTAVFPRCETERSSHCRLVHVKKMQFISRGWRNTSGNPFLQTPLQNDVNGQRSV